MKVSGFLMRLLKIFASASWVARQNKCRGAGPQSIDPKWVETDKEKGAGAGTERDGGSRDSRMKDGTGNGCLRRHRRGGEHNWTDRVVAKSIAIVGGAYCVSRSRHKTMAARYIVCLNRQGKVRMSKWYERTGVAKQRATIGRIHRLIQRRLQFRSCNSVDFGADTQLVFKKYNGLYFVVCVGREENGLLYLQAIPLFVQLLDRYFDTVSELDLVFNFYKMHRVLDLVFVDGELVATKTEAVLAQLGRM